MRLRARHVDERFETLVFELPDVQALAGRESLAGTAVHVRPSGATGALASGTAPRAVAFAGLDYHDQTSEQARRAAESTIPTPSLWLRRPVSEAGRGIDVELFTPAASEAPGEQFTLFAEPPTAKSEPKLHRDFLRALAQHFEQRRGAFYRFSQARLEGLAVGKDRSQVAPQSRGRQSHGESDLSELMDTMTGAARLQEALEARQRLALPLARAARTIPLSRLAVPDLPRHPWALMLQKLGKRPPLEPLAAHAPADFYFIRARSLTHLLDALDTGTRWAMPAVQALDGANRDAVVMQRYERQLALRRGMLTRALGPEVVGQVAVVGSDPYLREGTDLSLLFQVKHRSLFNLALAQSLREQAQGHGEPTETSLDLGGSATLATTQDGAVRRYRASIGDVEVVSNSAGALRRILATAQGKRERLADEPDFRYMLARDAEEPGDVLAYVGERFVLSVIGPEQKIGEARRQLALAELSTPGYAALLHGWVYGRSPATKAELVASGLLRSDELLHSDGTPIAWQPGVAARSGWGSVSALTPLIDLPPVQRVTDEEGAAYRRFAERYQQTWSDYVDPIAVRLSLRRARDGGQELQASLRVLPVSNARDLVELREMAGDATVSAKAPPSGARVVLGIGREAELRRQATKAVRAFGRRLELDWLGEWVLLGLTDSPRIASALAEAGDDLPPFLRARERRDELEVLADLPLYAAVAIRRRGAAAIALTALRKENEELLAWDTLEKERGVPVARVCEGRDMRSRRRPDGFCLYYALCDSALYVSLNERVLRSLVGADLDGHAPVAARDASAAQLIADTAFVPQGGMYTALAWLLQAALLNENQAARDEAEAVLRGAPEAGADRQRMRDVALATLGAIPVTVDGHDFELKKEGVVDPNWGSPHAPRWVSLPVPGSPVARLLDGLRSLRSQIRFDAEPDVGSRQSQESLLVRLRLNLAAD
jgi:hypothetical protein